MTPREAQGVLQGAFTRLRQGDSLGAEQMLAPLWNNNPNPPPAAAHLLGLIRKAQGRLADAEALLRQAIAGEPGNAEIHQNLGLLLAQAGFLAEAIDAHREAVRLKGDFAAARRSLARALMEAGKPQEAEAEAQVLLSRDRSAETLDVLSCALRAQGRAADALAAADEALALKPDNAGIRHNRAIALMESGRTSDSIAEFDALATSGLTAPALFLNRGRAYLQDAQGDKAEAILADGVRRFETDAALQIALAKVRFMRGAGADFASDLEAAIARHPKDMRLRLIGADMLRRADFHDRALSHIEIALRDAPEDPSLLAALGVVKDEMGRSAEALAPLTRALSMRPDDVAIRENRVNALLRALRADEAMIDIAMMRALKPKDQAWIAHETTALRLMGDPRYKYLCDYETMVQPRRLTAPNGYATIEAFNEALAASLRRLHSFAAHPLDQSLRHGSQTSQGLLTIKDPVIEAFYRALDAPIRAYIAAMQDDPAHPLYGRRTGNYRIAGAWSVLLSAKGYHVNHVHPEGWISSSYYVEVPPIVSQSSAHEGWIKFGEPRWPIAGCAAEKIVQPQAGMLVLFPSYMWHGTIPFSQGERMTAPFDAVPA